MPANVYASLLLLLGVVDVATFWIFSPHCTFIFFGSIIIDIRGNVPQPRTRFNKSIMILSCVVKNHVDQCLLCYSLHLWSYSTFILFVSLGLCKRVIKTLILTLNSFIPLSHQVFKCIWRFPIQLCFLFYFLVVSALW